MPQGVTDDNFEVLSNLVTCANKMSTKKLSKATAVTKAWNTLQTLPEFLDDDQKGFGQPAQSQDGDDGQGEEGKEVEESGEAKPSSEQAQEDKEKNKVEQEQLEKQDDEGEAGGEEEETEAKTETDEPEFELAHELQPEPSPPEPVDLASRLNDIVDDDTRLPDDIAEEVRDAVIEKRADLSELLSHLAKDSPYTVIAYTPNEDAMRAAETRGQTAPAEDKLRRILQDYRLRRTKDYRGLMSGRISGRRLHRVAHGDQRVFQRRERPEEIDMAVCLLMDLSGSVHRHRDLIEQIVVATSDAFKKEKMDFMVLGYSENHGVVNIPRLYDREAGRVNLDLRKEWGMTPSYEGLAAAVAQLLRLGGKKQKILFHITDGEPNVGGVQTIPELLGEARSKGIVDIHIYLAESGSVPDRFMRLYGEDTMSIDDINQLPEVVDAELRRRLKV